MSNKFTKLSKILVIATIASLFSMEAQANEGSKEVPLSEAFKAAYFTNGENAFRQSGIFGQINTILGIPKFPEQDVAADAEEVDLLYELALERQTSTGERLVTRDLDNPYNTSLREIPNYGFMK